MLDIPAPDTPCVRLNLGGTLALDEAGLHSLLHALQSGDEGLHASSSRIGTELEGRTFGVNESFGIDNRGADQHAPAIPGLTEQPYAIVHFDIDAAKVAFDPRAVAPIGDVELIDRFWEWTSQRQDSHASVAATVVFDTSDHSCIVSLPLRIPGDLGVFDAIPGLVLAKYESEASDDARTLYEVTVRQWDDQIAAYVQFRSALSGTPQMLRDLFARAVELAGFAVRPKPLGDAAR